MPALLQPDAFRALKGQHFRRYFYCQLASMSGTWMQSTAQAWLVWELSHSAAWVGTMAFCNQFSAFLMSPVAGVLVDRHERRRALMWVQVAALMQAFAMAAITMSGHATIAWIAALSVVLGVINAFELTSRHAFAFDVVGRADLSSAIALNSVAINGSRVIGPALGGMLIPFVGTGGCFLINGLSYFPALYALARIPRRDGRALGLAGGSFLKQWSEALGALRSDRRLAGYLALATFVSFFGSSYTVLLPSFSSRVLHGDSRTLGWLTAAAGLGAIFGALTAGGSATRGTLARFVLLIGVAMGILGLSTWLPLSLVAMAMIGVFLMGLFPRINNAIQHAVDDRMRARVLSLYNMTFLGAMPIGSLCAGALADRFGAPRAAFVGSGLFLAYGIASQLKPGSSGAKVMKA